jgi:hypothetical protein
MEIVLLLMIIVFFEIAAVLWGADSNDGINSPEWIRRQLWHGFH